MPGPRRPYLHGGATNVVNIDIIYIYVYIIYQFGIGLDTIIHSIYIYIIYQFGIGLDIILIVYEYKNIIIKI
jgi:hypothetical protein